MLCTCPESFHHFECMKVRRLLRAVSFCKSCKIPCFVSYFAGLRPLSRLSFARDDVMFDLAAFGIEYGRRLKRVTVTYHTWPAESC